MDVVIANRQPIPLEDSERPGSAARRWPLALAWLLLALSVIQLPPSLLLAYRNRHAPEFWTFTDPIQLAGVGMMGGVGILLATRRPANALGWLFLVSALLSQCATLLGQWAHYGLVTSPGQPGARLALWAGLWFGAAGFAVIPTLPLLLFPSGRLTGRWTRVLAVVSVLAGVALLLGLLTSNDHPPGFTSLYEEHANPLALDRRLADAGFAIVAIALCGLAAVVQLLVRFRRARGSERQQYSWVVLAMGLTVMAFIADFAARASDADEVYSVTGPWLSLSFPLIPVTMAIAILRYRLWDIDLIVSRTLSWLLLSACVVGIYVFVVGWLGTTFHSGDNLVFSLLATGVVAVLFQPLRERIQRRVNRLLFGERDEPYAVISRLGRRLEDSLAADADAMLQAIAATVREALNLPYVAVAVAGEGGAIQHAGTREPRGEPLRLPLVFQQETVGELLIAPRAPNETFSASDRGLLDDLARQAGIAVHALRLSHELQQARARLVSTREEERRRLRRDLHDGLGSQLAALILQTGTLRTLIDDDPAAARLETAELRAQLRGALASIRTLVDGLRPPAIDELGLLLALRERLRAFAADGLVVLLALPETLPPLPAAVEVAIYRIAEEAVANIARHAQASRCIVRLTVDGVVALEIEDDGVGIAPDARSGVGMQSMRERAEELGGSWQIAAPPGGGTRVEVRLPLATGEAHGG